MSSIKIIAALFFVLLALVTVADLPPQIGPQTKSVFEAEEL